MTLPYTEENYQKLFEHISALPIVSLITTGRTGSDFLQSLLDSHPQVLTFNGHFAIYSQFFSKALSFSVEGGRACDAADEFIGHYVYKLVSRYDIQEGKDRLGEKEDQSLTIETNIFKKEVPHETKGSISKQETFI